VRGGRAGSRKLSGAYYTPRILADFVSSKILSEWRRKVGAARVRLLDPAVGDGELLDSILTGLRGDPAEVEVFGFDTDPRALEAAGRRLRASHPGYRCVLENADFLALGAKAGGAGPFDIVIANPPYVRTQALGSEKSKKLAHDFGLAGRIDLCQAFLQAIARVLAPGGIAGVIVSNRFMTTRAGGCLRRGILESFHVAQVWDLGDTRLFEASVLPSILIMERRYGPGRDGPARFTTIYSRNEGRAAYTAANAVQALGKTGAVRIAGRGLFYVRHGLLDHGGTAAGIWRLEDGKARRWLAAVRAHSFAAFKDLGRIRVGVKSCADRIFIRSDWDSFPEGERPELLFRLTTHHVARRFRPLPWSGHRILYPYVSLDGRRAAVDLEAYPRAQAYLSRHRGQLEGREYLLKAGRRWYELWVPQEPRLWSRPKLVCWDIASRPMFWMDLEGTIVNGDCYWLAGEGESACQLLWLALGVANSSFIAEYYDLRFANRLYAGRRRFIKQYVEEFPLPDPQSAEAKRIAATARAVFDLKDRSDTSEIEAELDRLVRKAFGVRG
jgi:adenine-specific DNA-methyltransferase